MNIVFQTWSLTKISVSHNYFSPWSFICIDCTAEFFRGAAFLLLHLFAPVTLPRPQSPILFLPKPAGGQSACIRWATVGWIWRPQPKWLFQWLSPIIQLKRKDGQSIYGCGLKARECQKTKLLVFMSFGICCSPEQGIICNMFILQISSMFGGTNIWTPQALFWKE